MNLFFVKKMASIFQSRSDDGETMSRERRIESGQKKTKKKDEDKENSVKTLGFFFVLKKKTTTTTKPALLETMKSR